MSENPIIIHFGKRLKASCEVHYIGGCETCQGLAVMWGENAQTQAHRHATETGHKGIWYGDGAT